MVNGTPAVGRFVQVFGTLNASLEVVASRIIVKAGRNTDGDDDDDDDDDSPQNGAIQFKKQISLTPAVAGARVRGEAEIEVKFDDRRAEQEFEVKVEGAQASTEYRILVDLGTSTPVDFGTFTTNRGGSGQVNFSSNPREGRRNLQNLLPAGKTVRDFVSIQVLSGTTVVLRGTF
jgi:hypothetical protein